MDEANEHAVATASNLFERVSRLATLPAQYV
jgi:hypothetical protein